MSDLFEGQTMTYGATYVADGAAHTFTVPFKPDRIMLFNYTQSGTTAKVPISIWYKGMPDGDAIQLQGILDNGTATAKNILKETTNGFTVADTSGGATAYRAVISGVSKADPCVVTTSAAHGYSTDDIVRITQLGDAGATDYGMDNLNNGRFKIIVLTTTTFSLRDVESGDDIDSTSFVTYITGGVVNLESRVSTRKFAYDPVLYKVTFGSAVAGDDSDVVYWEAIKFGEYIQIGDIA